MVIKDLLKTDSQFMGMSTHIKMDGGSSDKLYAFSTSLVWTANKMIGNMDS